MRIASFNIENFFLRPAAMNFATQAAGKPILDAYARVNNLIQKDPYSSDDRKDILDALGTLKLKKSDESEFAILRQNHGRLISRPSGKPPKIVATGRHAWIGWVELKTEPVDEIATKMTAKVMNEVAPHVLAIIEAEDRTALLRFNKEFLQAGPFGGAMLIDGNDDRGIDVGLYIKAGFEITKIVSHVDDKDAGGKTIFSRDCVEYTISDPSGNELLMMVNHLKSKGFGSQAANDAKRKAQATQIKAIYDQRRSEGVKLIAIVGDFNDTPGSDPLKPLLAGSSNLKDIFDHSSFVSDGRAGTFGNGTAKEKFDYILLSPELFAKVTNGGVFRKGVWGGANGTLFPHFPEMTEKIHAASDHAAVFADVTL